MLNPWKVIERLESDNSRLFKEAIIDDEHTRNNEMFFEGVKLALDPLTTFGIKQVPEKKDEDGPGLSWDVFTLAVTGFITRDVTGNAAKDLIRSMMKSATKEQWNKWYRRILIKDLRCGVSEKTINNVVPGMIPVFACQLAHDGSETIDKLTGEKMIEVKLDGVRVLTVVFPDGNVIQYSRNGKELTNFQTIKDQFSKIPVKETMVFDGEVMSSSFQDLMKQVHRKENAKTEDAILHLFDVIPLEKFISGKYNLVQKERTAWLNQWYLEHQNTLLNVRVLNHGMIDLNTERGQNLFKMYNKSAVENGYEGIMIKDPLAPYECKRTKNWLKLKPFIEVSLEVQDVEEGTGRNEGRLGALVCRGSEDGKDISVSVGSGFSDSDRDEFYRDRSLVIGQIVEIRADAITKNQDGTYSLRFPRFLRFRGFNKGEKL